MGGRCFLIITTFTYVSVMDEQTTRGRQGDAIFGLSIPFFFFFFWWRKTNLLRYDFRRMAVMLFFLGI